MLPPDFRDIFRTVIFDIFSLSGCQHRNFLYKFHLDFGILPQIGADSSEYIRQIHLVFVSVQLQCILSYPVLDKLILPDAVYVPEVIGDHIRSNGSSLRIIEHIAPTSVQLGELQAESSVFFRISGGCCIPVCVTDDRKSIVVQIRDDNPSHLSILCGLIRIQLQDFIVIALGIDVIGVGIFFLNSHNSVFLIGIPGLNREAELLLQLFSYRIRHGLGNRNDGMKRKPLCGNMISPDIVAQFSDRRRIADQAFDFFSLQDIQHGLHGIIGKRRTVHHDAVFRQLLKFSLLHVSDPYPEHGHLFTDPVTREHPHGRPVRLIADGLAVVLHHRQRSSRGAAGGHQPVVLCVRIIRGKKLLVMIAEGIFIYNRKLFQRGPGIIVFIKPGGAHRMIN